MKAKVQIASTPQWPAVMSGPLYDPEHELHPTTARSSRLTGITPIELRIDGGDGPAAIAILE